LSAAARHFQMNILFIGEGDLKLKAFLMNDTRLSYPLQSNL
jgi:hypothetical protein